MSVFEDLKIDEQVNAFKTQKNQKSSVIIKREEVQIQNSSKKINPYDNNHIPANSGKITPLTDNNEVIGFIYECSCGEIAKVIFDFEESFG